MPPASLSEKPTVEVPGQPATELGVRDLVEGDGREVTAGDCVVVNYVGASQSDGSEFDASWDRPGTGFSFPLGAGMVIQGWDDGLEGATIGTRRELVIPGSLGYGDQDSGTGRPFGTLVFVVDVLDVVEG